MNTLLLLAFACSTHQNRLEASGSSWSTDAPLAVAEPLFWADTLEGEDPFRVNGVVGNVTFSGGYITENDGAGLHNVSKTVEVTQGERYREQVGLWLGDLLQPTVTVADLPPPKTRERRGTDRRDGTDNISLPRTTFQPVPADPLGQATLVPWVLQYTSHNAGWFYGQQYGTPAGARIHILLVAYDADGQVLGWEDVDASRISERIFSPSSPQLQDLLIVLEKKAGRKIEKAARR